MDRTRLKLATVTLKTIIIMALAATSLSAQDSETPNPVPPVSSQTTEQTTAAGDQLLRSYLQIQEQLHTALLAIETNREQLEVAAKQNNEIVAARLKQIEQALTTQGDRETKAARSSQRLVLIIAAIFGLIGVGAMVLTSWFQLRTMNRLTELGSAGGFYRQLEAPVTTVSAVPPAIMEAIQRLEQRLLEYQNTRMALPEPHSNGNGSGSATGTDEADDRDKLTVLLSKGQTLMRLNRPAEALEVFDDALAIDPENAEVYVKKGTALERMKKLDEAIACYDRAIAANGSLTLAYLCKGGVFNQMERFSEALECYEQALRSQHKTPAAA